jgi:hypothetical protein
MSELSTGPTPYPAVNAVLARLLAGVEAALGDQFVGMYLYGSLAAGDFDPQTSDVDFLVVTAERLPAAMIAALEALHAELRDSGQPWARKLEGSYVAAAALRRHEAGGPEWPTVNEGRFYQAPHGADWVIQRSTLRERGLTVAGPPLAPLIDAVGPDDLRRAVAELLRSWWARMLADPTRLRSGEYQAYAVLSMCRALHTLRHGTIASKPAAARWAQQTLDPAQAELIEEALAWRPGVEFDQLAQVLDLIRFTLTRVAGGR